MNNLESLIICQNYIGPAGASEIAKMINLKTLDIAWSEIGR